MSRRNREKRSFLRNLTDALLLLLLAYGTVFSFLSTFQPQVKPVVIAAWICIFCLFFLVVFCLPKYRWAVLLALALLYGFFLWQTWSTLVLGEVSLRCSVVNLYAQVLSFLQPIEPLATLTQRQWEAASTLTFLAVAFPLTGIIAWGTVHLRSFWLPFWCTSPVILAPMIITKIPAWLPLMTLVAVWTVTLLVSLVRRRDPEGGAKMVLLSLPATALLLLALTVLLPRAGYTQPNWAARAQLSLMGAIQRLNLNHLLEDGILLGPFGKGSFMAAAGSERVNLSAAGPLQYTGGTVLRVRSQQPGKLYLRGYTAAIYDGVSWGPISEMQEDNVLGYQPINFPAMTAPHTDYHTVTIENIAAPDGCVYFPYHLLTTPSQVAGAAFVGDSYLARDRNVRTHTIYVRPDGLSPDVADYTPLDGMAATAEQTYSAFVQEHYLDVPEETAKGLSKWMDSLPKPGEKGHDQISDYLNTMEPPLYPGATRAFDSPLWQAMCFAYLLSVDTKYDPATPATPEGEDFVSFFLNQSKQGYCMHYASAAAMLLRYSGIPARYVSGYVTNISTPNKVMNVADYAAHAWVEIYLDGYGWYPVDMTPGYDGEQLPWQEETQPSTSPVPTSTAPEPTSSAALDPTATPTPTPVAEDDTSGGSNQTLDIDFRMFIAPGVLLVLLLLLVLRRAVSEGLRLRRFHSRNPNKSVLTAYRYLLRLQRWGGTVPQEAEGLAQKARFSQYSLTDEERETMLDLVHTQAHKTDSVLSSPKRLIFRYLFGLY